MSFTALAFAADWEVVPNETRPGYFVDPLGFVHLRGALRRVNGSSEVALSLPAAARPDATMRFAVYGQGMGGVSSTGIRIDPNGDLLVQAPSDVAGNLVSLDGVTYHPGA